MKSIILVLLLIGSNAFARDSYVHGYTRSNGSYVQGYHRTTPDHTPTNNYGYYSNVNPYTGNVGTKQYNNYNNSGYSGIVSYDNED